MAYVQKNNPIPKTGCGRRRVSAMKMQGKDMSLSPKEQAAKAQGREVGEMNKSSRFHPDNVGRGPKTAVKMKSPVKALDRSKARRNDPDDGIVSASEASGGMFMKKSPMKKTYNQAWKDMSEAQQGKFANKQAFIDKAKVYNRTKFGTTEPTKVAKEASKATGEKVTKKDLRKTDYSAAIRVDKMKQTTSPSSSERHDQVVKDLDKFDNKERAAASTKTGKDDRKYRKARKARNQAEKEVYLKGNTKRAQRKFAKAIKKETKGDKARKA